LQPLDNGGARTTTTIQINHFTLIPDGVFEYQHSTGDNVEDSLRKSFEQWAEMDLVALLEALAAGACNLRYAANELPGKGWQAGILSACCSGAGHTFGAEFTDPCGAEDAGKARRRSGPCKRHEFCPCCLFTSFDAFKELIEGNGFYGLRMFAMRDETGVPQADCRVNGNDWEKGAEALRKYVTTWPEADLNFVSSTLCCKLLRRNPSQRA